MKATLPSVAHYEKVRAELNDKIERIKKDSDTKQTVLVPNAEFKIFNNDKNEYVKQYTTYPSKVEHTSFFTDEAVSYTHLDVYKRQDENRKRHCIYARNLDDLRYKEDEIDKDKKDGIKAEARYTCLLYTSRCV